MPLSVAVAAAASNRHVHRGRGGAHLGRSQGKAPPHGGVAGLLRLGGLGGMEEGRVAAEARNYLSSRHCEARAHVVRCSG